MFPQFEVSFEQEIPHQFILEDYDKKIVEKRNQPMKPFKTITLRLNTGEYAHLRKQAEATGLKMEPLLRQLILGVNLRPRPPDEYAALLRELSAIGNNVNQLANARGEATRQEITEAAMLVRQAWRLVKDSF